MPKLIDHVKRRQEIAEAAWRVILRDGVSRVSVRSVATEAHLSTGSLRHIFASQSDLLAFSMRLVIERATARILTLPELASPREAVLAMARELLPLDAERRAEMEVSLALFTQAIGDSALHQLRDESNTAMLHACTVMLRILSESGHLRADLSLELEEHRLHAVIDGLAAHLTYQQVNADTGWASSVVELDLDSLLQ